jgi:hypothetical protein
VLCYAPSGGLINAGHILGKELPRDLSHQPSAVTAVVISGAGTAVLHAAQCTQRLRA